VAAVILYCPTISKALAGAAVITLFCTCATSQGTRPRITEGSISYPFIADTKPLGHAREKKPFIIRSAIGASEYSVEIPDDASRYDIQIPLAELAPKGASDSLHRSGSGDRPLNAATTDKELVADLPALSKTKPSETAMMDAAFGVGAPEGPVQSPSYSLGIAKVNQYFKERNFELALVEINNLLAFYPNSPKLLKMKGTLLIKTGNRDLAMKSWQRAMDISPNDLALRRSIGRLNERIVAEQNARAAESKSPASATIEPVAPNPEDALDVTAH
jgi:tetratricopeptide (TPR) repeat protein